MPKFWQLRQIVSRKEEGQVLVLAALALVVMCGAVALSIDAGNVLVTRRNLQNTADAAALAAAQDLPSVATANTAAQSFGAANGSGADALGGDTSLAVQVTSTNTANDTVTVTAERTANYLFARVLGMETTEVSATATARIGYLSGGVGLQPWGLVADGSSPCISSINGKMKFNYNISCKLKSGAPGDGGDFGALNFDGVGGGGNEYRKDIEEGSSTLYRVGDQIKPEPGNMVGPTTQGIDARLDLPRPSGCSGDSFDEVTTIASDGTVSITPGCETHPRLILIPIVDKIDSPKDSTILGFAIMYLEDVKQVGGGNGHSEVYGRFIQTTSTIPGAEYNGTSPSDASTIILID